MGLEVMTTMSMFLVLASIFATVAAAKYQLTKEITPKLLPRHGH